MTPTEFRAALKELGVTQRWLATRLGVDRMTVSSWATGRYSVPPYVPYLLWLLDQLPHERGRDRRRRAA